MLCEICIKKILSVQEKLKITYIFKLANHLLSDNIFISYIQSLKYIFKERLHGKVKLNQ